MHPPCMKPCLCPQVAAADGYHDKEKAAVRVLANSLGVPDKVCMAGRAGGLFGKGRHGSWGTHGVAMG